MILAKHRTHQWPGIVGRREAGGGILNAMRDHSKLRTFELADQLAVLVYEHSRDFPRSEQFGLASQMRRAGVVRVWYHPGIASLSRLAVATRID